MKKIIGILLSITTIVSFFMLFNNEQMNQLNEMNQAEKNLKYNYTIIIPTKLDNKPRSETYEKLIRILDKYNGNIYYKRLSKLEQNQTEYVYINDDKYFSKFKFDSGRALNKADMNTNNFVETEKGDNSMQVGVISKFGENKFQIQTLKAMLEDGFTFSGQCQISFNSGDKIESFINDLEKTLNITGITLYSNNIDAQIQNYNWIIIVLFLIIMLLVLYDLLKSYKKIGIQKLLGYSTKTIYLERMLSLIKINAIIITITTIALTVIKFSKLNQFTIMFLGKFLLIALLETLVLMIVCMIPFIYLRKISTSNVIKNKKPTTEIIIFNFFIKIALLVLFIIAINKGIENFNRIEKVFTNSFKQWDEVKDFAIIPNYSNINMDVFQSEDYLKVQKELYLYFNEKGAIFANFSDYSPTFRQTKISETNYEYERDNVIVNPNYLNKYPIYDENGERVVIADYDERFIVLIPEKYKKDESAILNMFDKLKRQSFASISESQENKIIWIKSNQKVFSLSVDINPNEGNNVVDPIIHVMTEKNMTMRSYDIIASIDGSPLKVKVDDYLHPENSIRPILKDYDYDKYVANITSVNEQVASESKNVKEMINSLAIIISLLVVCITIIILQNIYNYFDKYKQNIAIKKLCGYKMIDKYRGLLILISLSWAIVFIIEIIMKNVPVTRVLSSVLSGLVIEISISLITLNIIEKKNTISILKGE